ncbi:hypothetical protein Zmor_024241 [Zophobas morio]|uniref:Uncharacterized protein n=1 Tax=Zophobas morio TaxID=2755281 RepID=A0AA38I0A0_9CUCU|nr:hypothetical protein Zmor_024241 [Zophobas morio]
MTIIKAQITHQVSTDQSYLDHQGIKNQIAENQIADNQIIDNQITEVVNQISYKQEITDRITTHQKTINLKEPSVNSGRKITKHQEQSTSVKMQRTEKKDKFL